MRASETIRRLIGPLELIHQRGGPVLLRLTQMGIFALWFVKLLLDPLWRLSELPREMFRPVGVLDLFSAHALDSLMTPGALTALLVLSMAACVLGFLRVAFPITSTAAAILLTVYSSVIRSFGPAVHTDIVLLLAVYALAGFAWADLFSKRAKGTTSAYPLITIVALLCLSYCLVGLNRAIAGGAGVFTGDTMVVWAVDASLRGYYFNTDIGWHVPEWPVMAFLLKAGLPAITVFEILAPLCLASSHFRWVFIPVMLSFHLLSLVFMNIFFFDDMFLYLLLVDWSRRFPGLRRQDRVMNK